MKFFIRILLLFLFLAEGLAQFAQDYSLRQYNLFLENPAYAGSYDFYHGAVGFRKQWSQLAGSPERMYATFHFPFNKEHILALERREIRGPHHGAGIKIMSDRTAVLRDHYALACYAYHLPVFRKLMLSMSLGAGVINNRIDQDKLNFVFTSSDPAVQYYSLTRPVMEAGFLMYHEKFFISTSSKQLFTGGKSFGDNSYSVSAPDMQIFAAAGCSIKVAPKLLLIPTVLNRNALRASSALEAYVNANWDSRLYAGLGYKLSESINIQAGFRFLKKMDLLYSYGVTTSFLYNKNSGNHELMIRLNQPTPIKIEHPADYW